MCYVLIFLMLLADPHRCTFSKYATACCYLVEFLSNKAAEIQTNFPSLGWISFLITSPCRRVHIVCVSSWQNVARGTPIVVRTNIGAVLSTFSRCLTVDGSLLASLYIRILTHEHDCARQPMSAAFQLTELSSL